MDPLKGQRSHFPKRAELTHKWVVVDAKDKILGRLSTHIATLLMGKNKPNYQPGQLVGDHVVVINAAKIKVTGAKLGDKIYTRYSGYPGGLRKRSLERAQQIDPTFPLMNAVKGMLQHNTLGADMLTRLRVYAGAEHGHQAQKPKALAFDEKGDLKIG